MFFSSPWLFSSPTPLRSGGGEKEEGSCCLNLQWWIPIPRIKYLNIPFAFQWIQSSSWSWNSLLLPFCSVHLFELQFDNHESSLKTHPFSFTKYILLSLSFHFLSYRKTIETYKILKNKISLLLQIELVNKIFLQWKPYLMWNQSQRSFHIRKLSTLTSQTFKCYTIGLLAHIYTWITETKDFSHKMCRLEENGYISNKKFLFFNVFPNEK